MLAEPFHGNAAQLLDNRSDCNNHPFIATQFCGLAIIYFRFRKFASSLWHIPLPQPVGTDMQQGTIISPVRWQLFQERSAFFCRSQTEYKLTVLPQNSPKEPQANVILGCVSWNGECEAHEAMSPFCTALITLLLQWPHLLPLGWDTAFQGKGQSAGKCPKESTEENWRFCKYSVVYCTVQHKEETRDNLDCKELL